MISDEYQCLFIHIPRCAGSSIESWIAGDDWWNIEPRTKHLLAIQARKIYSNVWDRYYNFSFVRHPIERTVSCLKYGRHFGISYDPTRGFSFSRYRTKFGTDIIVEHDHRFWKRDEVLTHRHTAGSIYGNILDWPLDFIGSVENLHNDLKLVARAIGKSEPFNLHLERSSLPAATAGLSEQSILRIENMCRNDMVQFSYRSMRVETRGLRERRNLSLAKPGTSA